jgi:hypothetical protein
MSRTLRGPKPPNWVYAQSSDSYQQVPPHSELRGSHAGHIQVRQELQSCLGVPRHLNRSFSEGGVGHLEALGNALGEVASTTNRPGGRGSE